MGTLKRIPFHIPLCALGLILIGILAIQSTGSEQSSFSSSAFRQLIFALLGIGFMWLFTLMDYEVWSRILNPLYWLGLGLLLGVDIIGRTALGAQRWLSLGGFFTFQPSEFFKLVVIILLAVYLTRWQQERDNALLWRGIILLLPPLFLILAQPDLGTAITIVGIAMGMLFAGGVNPFWLILSALLGAGTLPFVLHSYQKQRLLIFLNPESDPQGAGWSLTQSKIAIGSGGWLGKGYFSGSQTQLGYVPENSTDFIFSALGEEFGFLGATVVIFLFTCLLYSILKVTQVSRDSFGRNLVIGVFFLIFFHFLINIGMTMGIMPVTGVPLSLVSYGGSSMIANLMAIGLVISVYSRREKLF